MRILADHDPASRADRNRGAKARAVGRRRTVVSVDQGTGACVEELDLAGNGYAERGFELRAYDYGAAIIGHRVAEHAKIDGIGALKGRPQGSGLRVERRGETGSYDSGRVV